MYLSNATVLQDANETRSFQGVQIVMEPSWLLVVRLIVESIIALAGVIGNFVVCLVISKQRNKSPPNIYIRNVAVADLATLLVSFPLGIVREQFTYWPLGEFTCRYIFPLSDIFFGVSVWSITAIAVDRHRILTDGVPRQLALMSLTTARSVCAAIWIFSFLGISLPLVLVYEYQHPPNENPTCYAVWPNGELLLIYSIIMSLVTYAIPLFLIVVAYYTIKQKLRIRKSSLMKIAKRCSAETSIKIQMMLMKSRSKRFNRIMIPVVVVFAITILPLSIFRVIPHFFVKNAVFQKYSYIMFQICIFFYLFNSACNPLIYSLVGRRFRKSFSEMFSWK